MGFPFSVKFPETTKTFDPFPASCSGEVEMNSILAKPNPFLVRY